MMTLIPSLKFAGLSNSLIILFAVSLFVIIPLAVVAQGEADTGVTDTVITDSALDTTNAAATETATPTRNKRDKPANQLFRSDRVNAMILVLVFSGAILLYTKWAKEGKPLFLRKIPGLDAVEEAVGRATEMGRPVLFIPGIAELDEIETIAGISILGRVSRIVAQYDTPLSVPVRYPLVLAAGQEVVEQAYIEMGKKDSYDQDTVRYVAGEQFAFTATVNGYMMRERPATNIYMGAFFAESLLLAETGNAAGSIQIAGTARPEQLPFFIAACDYTLLGEELYAASAYLSHEPVILGGLKGQDFIKMLITVAILAGVILVTFNIGEKYLSWFISK